MMIGLNAKLLDKDFRLIINLVVDNVSLFRQNMRRCFESGINPTPKDQNFTDVRPGRPYIFFCKKNSQDLQKLRSVVAQYDPREIAVIDDEADYATPNRKVNDEERSTINELVGGLGVDDGVDGVYIGVTATPARLDLNATFNIDNEYWVYFEPHSKYVGQDFFFPSGPISEEKLGYRLERFEESEGGEEEQLRRAVLSFLCNVASINLKQEEEGKEERNFSMLIHTSGKTELQAVDKDILRKLLNDFGEESTREEMREEVIAVSKQGFPEMDPQKVADYVCKNITREETGIINNKHKTVDRSILLDPVAPFTFAIGGNIVSRGLTFENLLSMYFTRKVKNAFQQDTYIQRARMFGSRDEIIRSNFELWIPYDLYEDWRVSFSYHAISVAVIKEGQGAPLWLSSGRFQPTQSSSINRDVVTMKRSKEMSFGLFNNIREPEAIMEDASLGNLQKLDELHEALGSAGFPREVRDVIKQWVEAGEGICFHPSSEFGTRGTYSKRDISRISRAKGVWATTQLQHRSERHHLRIFYNPQGRARLFYRTMGAGSKLGFMSRDKQA